MPFLNIKVFFSILKLLNQRKLETFKERWWNQNPEKKVCEDDDEDTSGGTYFYLFCDHFETLNFLGISIYNIGGVFIVIFVGIALAIVTLIIEYWYYKYKKPNSRISTGSDKFAKQLQVKQQMANSQFSDGAKTDFGIRNRSLDNNGTEPTVPTIDKNW